MRKSKLAIMFVFTTILISSLVSISFSTYSVESYGEDVKIGFSWINGLNGASELIDAGYVKAESMGAQIEHREYRWDYLDLSLNSINEWNELYLENHPDIDSSLAIAVIFSNTTTLPFNITDFTPYTSTSINTTRFNDTVIVNSLKTLTSTILDSVNLSYISFGSEINGLFENYFDYDTKTLTNTVMLEDYVDLCEQMYDFVKANYPTTKVTTVFRYQPPTDIDNIEVILPYFEDACDVHGVSFRIFTDDFGFLDQPSYDDILERVSSFAATTTKKIAITNVYTVSDSRVGGSEYYQSLLVEYLFDIIEAMDSELEFLCWYTIFDYPPGYLSTYFSPFLEVHATAGLFTQFGDPKQSYYTWIDEMLAMGRLPNYYQPWKIAVISLVIAGVVGFLIYNYSVEVPNFKSDEPIKLFRKRKKTPKEDTPKEIVFSETKTKDSSSEDEEESSDEISDSK